MAENKFADEIMSDDELDNVAGGNCYESADDSRFLNSLNGSCNRYGATRVWYEGTDLTEEIEKAWATVGIKASLTHGFFRTDIAANKYYLNGQEISQAQARQHAMDVTGKQMTEADWNW